MLPVICCSPLLPVNFSTHPLCKQEAAEELVQLRNADPIDLAELAWGRLGGSELDPLLSIEPQLGGKAPIRVNAARRIERHKRTRLSIALGPTCLSVKVAC